MTALPLQVSNYYCIAMGAVTSGGVDSQQKECIELTVSKITSSHFINVHSCVK